MSSRNQSSCSQLWFCRSRSWGGRHGQADQRVAAADLHGDVRRERHIRRNPAPLSRRANLVRTGASFLAIAFAVLSPFRGRAEKQAAGNGPAACRFRPHRRPRCGRPSPGGVFVGALSHRALVTSCELRTHHKSFRDRGTANSSENVENGSGGTDAHPQEGRVCGMPLRCNVDAAPDACSMAMKRLAKGKCR
jgi:hypothetical protein